MRMTSFVLACVGLLLTSVTSLPDEPGKKDETKSEMKKFEGMWAGIQYVENGDGEGQKIAPEESPIHWVFKENKFELLTDVENASEKGTYKLDVEADPKSIDLIFPDANDAKKKEQKILGIYAFEDDTLKICYGVEGEKRPTEFKSEKDSKRILIVFKRLKK